MGKHLGVGFLVTFLIVALCVLSATTDFASSREFICLLIALFFGMVAACTSMILEKLNAIVELTAAQSAKLGSLEAKSVDSKSSLDD